MTWDDLDELNAMIYSEYKDLSLETVLERFAAVYQRSLAIVESMREDDLLSGERFAWRKGDPIWRLVAANTWLHYAEHRETITQWLSGLE